MWRYHLIVFLWVYADRVIVSVSNRDVKISAQGADHYISASYNYSDAVRGHRSPNEIAINEQARHLLLLLLTDSGEYSSL